ncbi:MAG: dihydropteroate synthase [Alphaproteobacteria bacterium]|nr:MAG: dihydropteroate synthase [Alphaproteobacteria bacterium]
MKPDSQHLKPETLLMGIVNVTPDSFYDGGQFTNLNTATQHAKQLITEGADIIDIGGESTRPGASPITVEDEINRTIPLIKALKDCGKIISIDTRHADVMQAAIDMGARMINDVSALTHDPGALDVVKNSKAEIVLMHMQGTPETMQKDPQYKNVVEDIYAYLAGRIDVCVKAGINQNKIIVDPGIGFGKTVEHNLELLRNIPRLKQLGCRVLIGVSRKSFIGKLYGDIPASERLPGSLAAAVHAVQQGADILRVHDVKETKQSLEVATALI